MTVSLLFCYVNSLWPPVVMQESEGAQWQRAKRKEQKIVVIRPQNFFPCPSVLTVALHNIGHPLWNATWDKVLTKKLPQPVQAYTERELHLGQDGVLPKSFQYTIQRSSLHHCYADCARDGFNWNACNLHKGNDICYTEGFYGSFLR